MLRSVLKLFGLRRGKPDGGSQSGQGESYTIRLGKSVETDEVFDAWTSGDLDAMLRVIDEPTNLIDRHFLLMKTVALTYRGRQDERARRTCREISKKHLAEFPVIVRALKKDFEGDLPRVSTFQQYATLLVEDGEYDRAIEVCQAALSYGLSDGTEGDYQGRIERIRKKILS